MIRAARPAIHSWDSSAPVKAIVDGDVVGGVVVAVVSVSSVDSASPRQLPW